MTRKSKGIIFIAFLLILLALSFIIPVLWENCCHKPHKPRPPPLGKYLIITFTCSQTEKPIVGLPVTIGTTTISTDAKGQVVFGSGYLPGTYTYTFVWWNGTNSRTVTIDCTKKNWYYYENLPNPEVHKKFILDTAYLEYPPVEGLDVTLSGYGTKTTNATGDVKWILDYPFGNYTLEWVWNSETKTEDVLWKDFVNGVWSKMNYLDPKSGGDTILG